MAELPGREEIDDEYKWDLSGFYEDEEAWEEEYGEAEELIAELEEYEDGFLEDGETLLETLQLRDRIARKVNKLYVYANLRKHEDMREEVYQDLANRAGALSSKRSSAISFIKPGIIDAGEERIEELMEEEDGLEMYENHLNGIYSRSDHVLDEEKEELLSEIGGVLGNEKTIFELLTNADMEYPTVETPDGEEMPVEPSTVRREKLMEHPDREFREEVYRKSKEAFTRFENVLAKNYENRVKTNVKLAAIRGYDSSRDKSMGSIPEEVYDNLLDTVADNTDVFQRLTELRAEVMDLDTVMPWDGGLPLAGEESPDIGFEEAKEYILEALQPLGEDYVERLKQGLEGDWVDVFPNKGKRGGAFCWGAHDAHPVVLMNWTEDISSMFTLAHELGHAMHRELYMEEQPYVYSGRTTFTAEVASNVNEALLAEYLVEELDDEEMKQHVVEHRLSGIKGSLHGQTLFAGFEHRAHQAVENGESLTAERLESIYTDVLDCFDDGVESTDLSGKTWMRIPHFYRPFYVYQYATGISAALSLSEQILEEGEPAAERYKDFLRKGKKKKSLPLLEEAGVDMESPEPVEDAIEVFEEYVEEMEGLLDE